MAATLFISYAHRDEAFLHELLVHLRPLVDDAVIDVWHDRRMVAGDAIFPDIAAALDRARIVLLLVSESFLASEECGREMWRALEQRRKRRSVVVPVILSACNWRAAPYGQFYAAPVDGAPIASAPDRDKAYAEVVRGVRALAERVVREAQLRRRRRTVAGVAGLVALLLVFVWLTQRAGPTQSPVRRGDASADATSPRGDVGVPASESRVSNVPDVAKPVIEDAVATPAGVMVIAEVSATAPDGGAWNPGESGPWRLPSLFLCFRQQAGEGLGKEVCQPTLFGLPQARVVAHASTSHFVDTYPKLAEWSAVFAVELRNQHFVSADVMARGTCRFGSACRLVDHAGSGKAVADVLVLPALESLGAGRRYLERCVDPDSGLARQWRDLFAAAGLAPPDMSRVSHDTLARGFLAVERNTLTPEMLDVVLSSQGKPRSVQAAPDAFRGSVLRAMASLGDDAAPALRAEVRRELASLKRNLESAGNGERVRSGCR